jgi:hypothetical protein
LDPGYCRHHSMAVVSHTPHMPRSVPDMKQYGACKSLGPRVAGRALPRHISARHPSSRWSCARRGQRGRRRCRFDVQAQPRAGPWHGRAGGVTAGPAAISRAPDSLESASTICHARDRNFYSRNEPASRGRSPARPAFRFRFVHSILFGPRRGSRRTGARRRATAPRPGARTAGRSFRECACCVCVMHLRRPVSATPLFSKAAAL